MADAYDPTTSAPDIGALQTAKLRANAPRGQGTGNPVADANASIPGPPTPLGMLPLQSMSDLGLAGAHAVNQTIGTLAYPFATAADAVGNAAIRGLGFSPKDPTRFTDPTLAMIGQGQQIPSDLARAASPTLNLGRAARVALRAGLAGTGFTPLPQQPAINPTPTINPTPASTPAAPQPPAMQTPDEGRPDQALANQQPAQVAPAEAGGMASPGNYAPSAPQPAPAMTDAERNNAPFVAQNARYQAQLDAATAKGAQDAQSKSDAMLDQGRRADASYQADQIRHGTELFAATPLGGGNRRQQAQAGTLTAEMNREQAIANAPSTGNRNFIGEQEGQAASINKDVAGQQSIAENALTNPLHVEQLKQDLEAGGTKQKVAELQLKQHETIEQMRQELANPNTSPERQQALQNSLLVSAGKEPYSPYAVSTIPGQINYSGNGQNIQPQTLVYHKGTGQVIGRYSGNPPAAKPPQDEAMDDAKAAIVRNPAAKAAINQRLQGWGYPTI